MTASFNSVQAAASRRAFLKVSAAAGGGLLRGFALPRAHMAERAVPAAAPSPANAPFAATGIRLRQLPIERDVLAGRKLA
jgi:hypothetical protein